MKVAALIPIKLNNERFKGKNTKCFSDGTPLMSMIQRACLNAHYIDEVFVFCSNEAVNEYLEDGVRFLKRPQWLDGKEATCNDIINEFVNLVDADIYVMSHATGPFTTSESIDACVKKVMDGEHDSAFMAEKLQNFLWQDGRPLNFSVDNVPRTQDLEPIYLEATGAYVFRKEVFEKYHSRVGKTPYIHEVSEIEARDIDYEEDFKIADAIYMNIIKEEGK